MLELKGLKKVYNPGTVREMCLFEDFSLRVPKGQFLSIVGSNGSGKTSLLNILCGSIPLQAGQVMMEGVDITQMPEHARARKIGRIHQNPAMGSCAGMSILENMALSDCKNRRMNLRFCLDVKKVSRYKDLLRPLGLGLENMLHTKAGNLSGGQRQALAMVMSMMTPIEYLILDEHTAALDPKTADTIMKLTDQLVKEKGLTALMVTHNIRYALDYGNRLLMMHQGGIVLDKADGEKDNVLLSDVLQIFNQISIECGN